MRQRAPRARRYEATPGAGRLDSVAEHAVTAVAGAVTAGAGTLVHRWEWAELPAGIALALLTVMVGSVFARAAAGGTGVFLYLLAGFLTTQVMTFVRPADDILVTGETISYVWMLGQPVAALAAVVAPRRWFSQTPQRDAP